MDGEITCILVVSKDVTSNMLSGSVIISTPGVRIIQLALIEITGTAQCAWKLDKTIVKCMKIINKGTEFTSKEDFYYSRHTLFGGNVAHRHKGSETFHFSCGWPTRVPASWIGEYGSLKFMGKISVYEGNDVHVHLQEIEVNYHRDLTLEMYLLHESRVDVHRTFNFAVTHVGNMELSIWVPISGIAAGQELPVLCTVVNNSKLKFGGLQIILTRIDIYRFTEPVKLEKRVRTDVCRIGRQVNILDGKYEFYCVIKTDEDTYPTNQFYKCQICHVIYELWACVEGAFTRYSGLGSPKTYTPGIPIIIGTEPLRHFSAEMITANVMQKLLTTHAPVFMDMLPPDEEVEELLHNADEELDELTINNLTRQMAENEALLNQKLTGAQSENSSIKYTSISEELMIRESELKKFL